MIKFYCDTLRAMWLVDLDIVCCPECHETGDMRIIDVAGERVAVCCTVEKNYNSLKEKGETK